MPDDSYMTPQYLSGLGMMTGADPLTSYAAALKTRSEMDAYNARQNLPQMVSQFDYGNPAVSMAAMIKAGVPMDVANGLIGTASAAGDRNYLAGTLGITPPGQQAAQQPQGAMQAPQAPSPAPAPQMQPQAAPMPQQPGTPPLPQDSASTIDQATKLAKVGVVIKRPDLVQASKDIIDAEKAKSDILKNQAEIFEKSPQGVLEKTKAEQGAKNVDAANKSQELSKTLLANFDRLEQINGQTPYGSALKIPGTETSLYDPVAVANFRGNLKDASPEMKSAAANSAEWQQLSGTSILNTIKQLEAGGNIRTDIPIVKEVQKSGGIPQEWNPEARARILTNLRTEIQNQLAATKNVAGNTEPSQGGAAINTLAKPQAAKTLSPDMLTPANLKHTADKYGITVYQLQKDLKAKGLMP